MDDLISRQAAIDALYHVDEYNGRSVEAIRNLPSAQPKLEQITPSEQGKSDKLGVKSGKTCADTISRQAAIDALNEYFARIGKWKRRGLTEGEKAIRLGTVGAIKLLPSAQLEQRWIPTSEKLPDELAEVNVTWKNTEPESYYDFVKGHCFTGTAIYFRGRWYWYSAVCVDYLREYGFSPNDEMDDAIKVLAWMPLPEPYQEGEQE